VEKGKYRNTTDNWLMGSRILVIRQWMYSFWAIYFTGIVNTHLCGIKCSREAQLMLTNPRDAFRGQSRSPNMVQFDMLGMVSY